MHRGSPPPTYNSCNPAPNAGDQIYIFGSIPNGTPSGTAQVAQHNHLYNQINDRSIHSDETTPLRQSTTNPSVSARRKPTPNLLRTGLLALTSITTVFLFLSLLIHIISDYSDTDRPDVRDRIRREWETERRQAVQDLSDQLNKLRRDWDVEHNQAVQELNNSKREWEIEYHQAVQNLTQELNQSRRQWETERQQAVQNLTQELRQSRREWEIERRQAVQNLTQELDKLRGDWDEELLQRRQAVQKLSHELKEMRRQWDDEVLQHQKDTERRIRAGLFWRDLAPKLECIQYDTREWTAELMNVPSSKDGLRWCRDTTVVIHGNTYPKADYCTLQNGRVYGHWTVSGNEPSCKPLFENFRDKGCVATGAHHRRIEAPLANLRPEDNNNWREMCTSTPANLYGLHFDSPDHCMNWGQWGIWEAWIIDDENC